MTVTASGFQKTTVSNVVVSAGTVFTVPVQLAVGQQATAVEVSAAAVAIDTTTSTESDTIPTTALQDIPLNGRDFTQLIAVKPGYGGYSVGGFGSLNGTPRQSDELADRRHRQQRYLAQHPGRQSGRRLGHRGRGDAD